MQQLAQTAILLISLATGLPISTAAQDQGPMAAPPKFEVNRIPSVPHPGPPPIPQAELIQKFAANEDLMQMMYDIATFTETIRVEEFSDPGGKYTVTGEVYTKPDGQRFWKVTKQPETNLKFSNYSLEDVELMANTPLFPLTSGEIANYNFLYAGQDKLDELNTYVFQVKPKQLSRTRKFFDGVIWVDDHDLTIVKSYGKFVSEVIVDENKLPFSMFETYRENFRGKYWLPTYTNSDDYVPEPNDEPLHVRMVVHSTNFDWSPSADTGTSAMGAGKAAPSPSQP